MQSYHRRLSWPVINSHYIKPAGALTHMAFRQEPFGRADYNMLLFPGYAEFGES